MYNDFHVFMHDLKCHYIFPFFVMVCLIQKIEIVY